MFGEHCEPDPVGILSMLRGLGCLDLAALPIFSIPDTDNVTFVSLMRSRYSTFTSLRLRSMTKLTRT